jgi:hypothetical protein
METSDTFFYTARRWLHTPFLHQGRKRASSDASGGVDCLGLLMGIAGELGLKDKRGLPLVASDQLEYSKFPDGGKLAQALGETLHEIPLDTLRPGDIGLFIWDASPRHLGMFMPYPAPEELGLLHAYAPARAVIEHRLTPEWHARLYAAYRLPCIAARTCCALDAS